MPNLTKKGGDIRLIPLGLIFAWLISAPSFPFPAAKAAEDCDFQPQLNELENIQKNPLPDYLENIKQELSARKNILKSATDCSIGEVQDFQTTFNHLNISAADAKDISDRLLANLNETLNYYQFQKTKIDDLGIQGSKDFARDLKNWRDSNYNPLAQEITNFLIWNKNQGLMDTASNRFQKIESIVRVLKLDQRADVTDALNDAQKNLNQALENNGLALKAFQNFNLPDDSLLLIKNSLDELAKTYQDFFDISQNILK